MDGLKVCFSTPPADRLGWPVVAQFGCKENVITVTDSPQQSENNTSYVNSNSVDSRQGPFGTLCTQKQP